MNAPTLQGGFDDPARQAARAFRTLMTVMARPGDIARLTGATGPAPLSQAAATAVLTLCDADTPLFLAGGFDHADIRAWVAFHTGAPIVEASDCAFALGRWDALTPLSRYPAGTPDFPDRSATLIVECDRLAASGARLSGPGIKDSAALSLPERQAFRDNGARFPLGLDFLFTAGAQIAALPRSTRVE